MKNLFNIFSVLVLIIMIFGCQELDSIDPVQFEQAIETEGEGTLDPKLQKYLRDVGLSESGVKPFFEGYLVEGDIYVSQKVLNEYYEGVSKKGENSQYRYNDLINTVPGSIYNISYKFDPSVPTSSTHGWRLAAHQAYDEWENVRNVQLRFQEVTSGSADITIYGYYDGSNSRAIASAARPALGKPGNIVYINTYYNFLQPDEKLMTLVHEIGHSIGFHHTNYNDPANPSVGDPGPNPNNIPGVKIAGTWVSDAASVMNHTLTAGYSGFTYLDQLSVRTMYPLDLSEKPFYAYLKNSTGGYNWTPYWSTYGFAGQGFSYWGFIGYVFTSPKAGTVPLYKYRHNVTNVDYLSLNPNLGTLYPGYVSQGIIARVYTTSASDRTAVYEWYHPNKGFYFTTLVNDGVVASGGWTGGGIAFYTLKLDQYN